MNPERPEGFQQASATPIAAPPSAAENQVTAFRVDSQVCSSCCCSAHFERADLLEGYSKHLKPRPFPKTHPYTQLVTFLTSKCCELCTSSKVSKQSHRGMRRTSDVPTQAQQAPTGGARNSRIVTNGSIHCDTPQAFPRIPNSPLLEIEQHM